MIRCDTGFDTFMADTPPGEEAIKLDPERDIDAVRLMVLRQAAGVGADVDFTFRADENSSTDVQVDGCRAGMYSEELGDVSVKIVSAAIIEFVRLDNGAVLGADVVGSAKRRFGEFTWGTMRLEEFAWYVAENAIGGPSKESA